MKIVEEYTVTDPFMAIHGFGALEEGIDPDPFKSEIPDENRLSTDQVVEQASKTISVRRPTGVDKLTGKVDELVEEIWNKFSAKFPEVGKQELKWELVTLVYRKTPEYVKANTFDPYKIINNTCYGGA
ncbi:MAG: hypothetical protein K1000chlam2_01265 [Chlamydiae bacterium]|nr:hypothetical protein [Chlamydiota bacterium]